MIAVAASAVCVPLNTAFKADEWRRYFGDLRIAALLTLADMDTPSRDIAHSLGISVVDLLPRPDEGACAFSLVGSASRGDAHEVPANGTDDAFVLLSSGTTSRPKLVPLTHAGVCLSAHNVGATLALTERDRLLNVLPLFHAHGLFSGLLAALAAGSCVVCTTGFDATAFFHWLADFQPTWYTAVPTIHRSILSAAASHAGDVRPSSLRLIRSASSSLPTAVLRGLEAHFGVPVIDTYGMTEAASQIAANPLGRCKPGSVGRSAGAEIAIMDDAGRPLPAGERGEIALRGPTITRGYENDEAATMAAFHDGWFRTGDLGCLDDDGYLFIAGRIKDAINRGGQEIAPAEVDAVLLTHPDVVDAVAFPIAHPRLGEEIGAAIVVRQGAPVSGRELREFARERLARFKVPGLIRIVPEIPKSPSGKINRRALAAALGMTKHRARANQAGRMLSPRSELELQLAEIWAELLEMNEIGVDQDVFELGADSLTVTQIISRLRRRFGVDLSFEELFDTPTVADLAARVESSQRDSAVVPPSLSAISTDGCGVRLSFQQQRIYFLSKLDPTGYNYHVLQVARLSGPLDCTALEASIASICKRHEILRSTFVERAGEPMQMVQSHLPRLERVDMPPCAKSQTPAEIERQARESIRQPFALAKHPAFRAKLLRFDEQDHALVITVHHVITDGWSWRLFWEELETLYASKLIGTPPRLPELPIQYRQFAEWQHGWLSTPAFGAQVNYWQTRLDGLSELPLRTDRPRSEIRTGRGARHELKLSRGLSRAIKSVSRAHRATPFMTLLTAFQCLLYRYTGHEDIAVGSLVANRNNIQTERLIGMFANTIILRTDLSGGPTFSELLRRVRQVTLEAYRNQDVPIEHILQALPHAPSRNALSQVGFILQNSRSKAPALKGLSVSFMDIDPGIARFDFMLELAEAEKSLRGWFEYSTDLFDSDTIGRMAAHFQTLLEAIVANPDESISRLSLLSAAERGRILCDGNRPTSKVDSLGTFCRRFLAQAGRTPEAVAVSAGNVRLTYRELGCRSSAIANRLAEEGVGPEVVVILLADRSIDLLAATIAVLQVGGAFLPLDPRSPAARLAQTIRHSRTPLVLVGQGYAAPLDEALSGIPTRERPRVLPLEKLGEGLPRGRARSFRAAASSLACVIYTSGSTGIPKGAMIEQQGLVNHLLSKVSDLGLASSDVVAHTAPQSFVISLWQFLTALMVGARVHICADDTVRDPALLVQEIKREGVTILQVVPSLLRVILERTPAEPAFRALERLRWMISTGEPLAPDLCRDWFLHFPDVPLMNAYGSSECSDDVATYSLTAAPATLANVPIGHPIANARLYVLDAHLQPVPIGVAGELYVGGIGVGRGYLNDPEQTRRRFLRDPFSNGRAARLYRTGDLARWRADLTLECLGRLDHQVKIRGYRIELGEIEHALAEHPDVQSAVALARGDAGGEARLIAYVAVAAGRHPKAAAMRDFLKARLPGYMIPSGFVFLERIPLTPHGKVDRAALLAVRQGLRVAGREFVAPRNSTEELLASIWAELLELEEIGVLDDFFDLGGHSLLVGQVLSRIKNTFRVSLPMWAFFGAPTIDALARRVDEAREMQLRTRVVA